MTVRGQRYRFHLLLLVSRGLKGVLRKNRSDNFPKRDIYWSQESSGSNLKLTESWLVLLVKGNSVLIGVIGKWGTTCIMTSVQWGEFEVASVECRLHPSHTSLTPGK